MHGRCLMGRTKQAPGGRGCFRMVPTGGFGEGGWFGDRDFVGVIR